jgi:osmoprotectant transport system ATP-binding protein
MIRMSNVGKVYDGSADPAVTDLTLDVDEGDIVVLVGPSGCGKTTTLKMINRLIDPTSGSITVAGRDITECQRSRASAPGSDMSSSRSAFSPPDDRAEHRDGACPARMGQERTMARIDELFEVVDLDPTMRNRYPSELSGGQRQRVGVARALAADPPVMLMDEPFGAVDPIVRRKLQDEFLDLQERLHKTIVMVTHDIDEAIKLGDRIAILNLGGILEQYDTPMRILEAPANDFVMDFLGPERGLKRLSLIPIRTAELAEGPVVGRDSTIDDARAVMARHGVDWIGIGTAGILEGWIDAADLGDGGGLPLGAMRPFRSRLSLDASLLDALDVVVSSRTSVAAVFDDDRYVGMLTAETIGREIIH